jgi:hypothetical protein
VRVRGLGARDENEAVPGSGFGVGPSLLDLRERNGAGVDADGDSLGQGAKLGDVLAGADRALTAADDLQPGLAQAAEGIAAVGLAGARGPGATGAAAGGDRRYQRRLGRGRLEDH